MFCGGAPRPRERIIRQHSALSTENFVPIIYTQNQMFANIFFDRMLNFLQNFEKRFGQIQDSYPITYYRPLSKSRSTGSPPTPNTGSRHTNKRRPFLSVAVRYRPLSPVTQGSFLLPDRRTANHRTPPTPHKIPQKTLILPPKNQKKCIFLQKLICKVPERCYIISLLRLKR